MNFIKYHGTGNDFIVVDARKDEKRIDPALISALCRRNTGVGADGVLFACGTSTGADAAMRIFNADGSEAEMCGNGIRCLAKYLYEHGGVKKESMFIDTKAGAKRLGLTVREGRVMEVEVEIGMPEFAAPSLPSQDNPSEAGKISLRTTGEEYIEAFCLSLGNPHCVIFVENVKQAPVPSLGPQIEKHELFPYRTNVEFVQVLDASHLAVRVWERGVGETAACGTGACAAFAAALHAGRGKSPMLITLPGGDLKVRVDDDGHIYLAGPAVEVYRAVLSPYWEG